MAAKNDITGHLIQTRDITQQFTENFDKIDKTVRLEVEEPTQEQKDYEAEKARFFEQWHLSGEEGERVWEEKLKMLNRTSPMNLPYVRDDIKVYQSMIDGTMIEGKKAHREHLKRNGCIEAGDMPIKNPERPKDNSLKERLIYEVMHNPANRNKWR